MFASAASYEICVLFAVTWDCWRHKESNLLGAANLQNVPDCNVRNGSVLRSGASPKHHLDLVSYTSSTAGHPTSTASVDIQ